MSKALSDEVPHFAPEALRAYQKLIHSTDFDKVCDSVEKHLLKNVKTLDNSVVEQIARIFADAGIQANVPSNALEAHNTLMDVADSIQQKGMQLAKSPTVRVKMTPTPEMVSAKPNLTPETPTSVIEFLTATRKGRARLKRSQDQLFLELALL